MDAPLHRCHACKSVQTVQPARPHRRLLARLIEGGRWQVVLIENNTSGLDDDPLALVQTL